MPRIAIVTGTHLPHLPREDHLLLEAVSRKGAVAEHVAWNDPDVCWDAFDLGVIRSTWDYTRDVEAFLAWTRAADEQTRLVNPAHVVEWNSDKHYLRELAGKGVPVVPTTYIEAGAGWVPPDLGDYVIKPVHSGGGRHSGRFRRGRDDSAATALANTVLQPGCVVLGNRLRRGRALMVQPYMPIDTDGEKGIVVLGGRISHAIRKPAVLRDGGGSTTLVGTRGAITAADCSAEEAAVVRQVLRHVPGGARQCMYARVDLVRDAEESIRLMELELLEPQLFFDLAPGSAECFADILIQELERPTVRIDV